MAAVKTGKHREKAMDCTICQMFGIIGIFFALLFIPTQHHNGGIADNDGKNHFHNRPQCQQSGTDGDKNHAENNRADNPPVQNAVAQALRHFKPSKNRHH